MIKKHERVVLKTDLPAEKLEAGDVGTVVHVYRNGLAYEVEFTTPSKQLADANRAKPDDNRKHLPTSLR
jgi:hypothetical protein